MQNDDAIKLDSTKSAAVDPEYRWRPMRTCPRGVKLQLKGKGGVAVYSHYDGKSDFWVGWAPLPTGNPEE